MRLSSSRRGGLGALVGDCLDGSVDPTATTPHNTQPNPTAFMNVHVLDTALGLFIKREVSPRADLCGGLPWYRASCSLHLWRNCLSRDWCSSCCGMYRSSGR